MFVFNVGMGAGIDMLSTNMSCVILPLGVPINVLI